MSTPKIIPILVSVGVAAGTFSGLYFGLGTKKDDAIASTGEPSSGSGSGSDVAAGSGAGSDVGSGSGSGSAVAAGSGSGSGSGSAAVAGGTNAAPAVTSVTLQFVPMPSDATITVDGKPVTDGTFPLEFTGDKKVVKVVAKASGYRTLEKKVTVTASIGSIPLKLVKRSSGGGGGGGHHTNGPGDKIDI